MGSGIPLALGSQQRMGVGTYPPCKGGFRKKQESLLVELVRNKASGKYFVVLDGSAASEFLVITPEGKVKHLERNLFEPIDTVDPEDTRWMYHLTRLQREKYAEYIEE